MNKQNSSQLASSQQKKKIMTLQNDFDYKYSRDIQIATNNQTPGELYKKVVQQKLNQYFDRVDQSEKAYSNNMNQHKNEQPVMKNISYLQAREDHKKLKKDSNHKNEKYYAQNQYSQKKNTKQSQQYNVYDIKNYEYGEYSPQSDSQNWQQKQRQPNINQENQEYKQQMNESEYQEKYLDYPQNVYLKQQYQNKPQIQNKKQTPNADLRYQRNYQQADGYENERGQFRNKQDSRQQQLYHDDSQDYQNKINAFHKENLHQHSQKKLKSMEQTQDQALDGIYEKYYKKKDNYFDVSPYSQRYNPKGSDQQYYDNDKSQNSQNKQENSECELSYEDILYEGNQSFEEGRQSQSRSNKKMDFGNNSQQANQFWNMRKHLHSRDNSNNKKSNNQDNSYLQNSYNDTKSKGILSKSNFIDYDNNNEQQNQDRSRSQSQHDYQHPQTHRDQKQNNLEYNYYERSNSIDRSYQDKPIRQRLQFEGTEKSLQREIKKNNYFQEGSQSRDNSQIFEQSQQIKKQPLKQNQQIMHEYNLTDQSNQSIGFQKQIQFEQNSQRNNKEKLLNDSQHFSSNLQQQYQQNQQQLFINQLIQNAHSAHQSLELDLQKISEENTLRKMMQQNRSQSNINQLQQNNLQQVQSIQQNNKLQSQPIQADVNIIISQQNLLIQNLIQQLLQVQAQQMVNTINKSHANQQSLLGVNNFNLSQSDLLKNQTGQGSSSNMQQINYLLQQQMNLKKSQNLLDSNLLQLINPINQQLLLNLLQAQEQFDQTNQSLKLNQQLNAQNLSEDILQGSLPRSLSNTQILNLQDNQLIQSPAKLVEDKLKDISETQDNMSRRLVQILDYSKNKLNSSLSQKQIQSSQGLSNQNQVAEKNQNTLNDQYGNSTKQQQKNEQKNFPRSKSQLNVYDNSNQEVKDYNNKQSFQNFSKIMDDIIYKQEVTIKNLQRERKLSKIAKEQQENSQNSIQQTSADEIVSKELSEIQHYIKNVQNSCNQIDTNKPKTKSTKELMQNMKHLNDALEKEQKGNHQMAYSIHAQPNHHEQNNHTTSGISKPNTQRKRWGDDSTYNSSKQQHLNLNEVETPQGMINFRNEEQEEIEDIKHRFKQDFKKYLEKSNSKNIPPSKKEYSPSNKQKQIQKEENSDFTEQVKPNYSNGSQTQQTIRSPKRWDIPLNKQSDQNKYQKSETSEFQESYQLSKQPQEKKSPQQWTINWDDENQEDPTNSQKQTQSNLKKNYSRKELQANTSPFANNSNLQPKQALNNIFEQKNEAQNQKGRSLSSHQKDDREQIKKQYQQYKPPTFQHQESFKPQGENHNEFKDTNYQNNNQANAYNIVFDGDNIDDVSKSKQSLADIFKNRKQELLDKLEDQRKKKVRDHSQQPSKTKEELAQIRKELLQQTRRRDLSANNNNMRQNQASMSRGRQNSNNLDMSFEFKNDQKNKSIKDPPPELLNRLIYGLKAKVDKKDYKKLTMKNYELLPEIKKKKEEEKKRQEMAERIKHKKEYEQKLRQRMKNSNLNKSQMQSSQIQSYNQLQYNQNYQQQQDQQLYQYQNYI
ncbi:hypothetical protein ABPG72_010240 [Tetrahymena utriculariae]